VNTVTVFLRVYSKAREEFLQTFRSLSDELKGTQGLKKIELYQDVDDANAFHLAEEWITQDDLNKHLDSERFRVLMGALKVLSEEAEIRYYIGAHPIEDREWGLHRTR
jgi:quinol monooxygenase YgiN